VRVLVLGGTVFLGRHAAETALRRGHRVTVFTRGIHGEPPAGAEHLTGDRDRSLAPLCNRTWDAVIDTSGYHPAQVEASATLLAGVAERYVFVSSVSAYRDWPAQPVGETSPVHDTGDDYGALKAACERAAEAAMPGRVTHVRAGQIVGTHEYAFRLAWWVARIGLGGTVIAPGDPAEALQLIDARDLAAWMLDAPPGVFNATALRGPVTMEGLLQVARAASGSDAEFRWIGDRELLAAGVEPWDELPLWAPQNLWPGTWRVETARAEAAGLRCRPVTETVSDVWSWLTADGDGRLPAYRPEVRVTGLSAEHESRLLDS
jgi:2'-hydroxyisoflavone reductase